MVTQVSWKAAGWLEGAKSNFQSIRPAEFSALQENPHENYMPFRCSEACHMAYERGMPFYYLPSWGMPRSYAL